MPVQGEMNKSQLISGLVNKLKAGLEKEFSVKTEVLGPDAAQQKEVKVLNRIISWNEDGISWEPDLSKSMVQWQCGGSSAQVHWCCRSQVQ